MTLTAITATRNRAEWLPRCIESVASQTYVQKEHVIIDGGSTDGTVELLQAASARHPHLRWISESDSGLSDALNKGLRLASGDLIGVIGDDDYYEPSAFQQVVDSARMHPEVGMISGNCRIVRNDGSVSAVAKARFTNLTELLECWKYWGSRVFFPAPSTFIRREVIALVGGFEERDRYAMDYRHWIKIAERFPVLTIDEILANFRQDEGSITHSMAEKQWAETVAISREYWGNPGSPEYWRMRASYTRNRLSRARQRLRGAVRLRSRLGAFVRSPLMAIDNRLTHVALQPIRRKWRLLPVTDGDGVTAKAGLAVSTYNRLVYLKRCIASLEVVGWGGARCKVIVDDGSTAEGYEAFLLECERRGIFVLRNEQNRGVAATKNRALRFMLEQGCEELFLMEDDIVMKSPATLAQYLGLARESGLEHLNFALHGDKNWRRERLYRKGAKRILYYPEVTGAFSYYSRRLIEKIGYMDEEYPNALEHVDFTYRAAAAGLTLPFWYFADHPLNSELLEEQPQALEMSVIRQGDWVKRFEMAKEYWLRKHGSWPERPGR